MMNESKATQKKTQKQDRTETKAIQELSTAGSILGCELHDSAQMLLLPSSTRLGNAVVKQDSL